MSQFTVKSYRSSQKQLWNNFVAHAKNATFLFNRNFMDYHSDRFTDASLLVFKNEEVIALLPANKVEDEVFSHQGLSYGGLIVNEKTRFEDIVEALSAVLNFLENKGVTFLHVKELPLIYHKHLNQEIDFLYTVLKAEVVKNESYYVIENLDNYQPNRNRKRAVKLANDNSITVKQNGDLPYFWEHILSKNLFDKFGVNPVHTIDEIQLLMSRFPDEIQFFSAESNTKMHAGVVMFISDQVAHFQYSSGDDMRAETGSLDVLFHNIIEQFKDRKYVSFGASSTDKTFKIDKGLAYWKESFGAKLIPQRTYKIKVSNSVNLNSIFK